MTEDSDAAYLTIAPDWLCEVLSPATEKIDRGKKLKIYARESVSYVWLLSPIARTLEVWRRDKRKWRLAGTHVSGERVRAEPFSAVELALDDLWPR